MAIGKAKGANCKNKYSYIVGVAINDINCEIKATCKKKLGIHTFREN